MEWLGVVAGNFAASFSLEFRSIFVHIPGSIEPITLIWVSLKISFPRARLESAFYAHTARLKIQNAACVGSDQVIVKNIVLPF